MAGKNQAILFGVLLLLGLLVAAGLYLFLSGSESSQSERVVLAVASVPHSVLIFVAREKGFFAEEGLEVQLVKFSSGKEALDGLLAGGADLATAADFPIALARLSNQDFFVVATMWQGEDVKIIARKDRGIKSLADLQGKRIATKKGSSGDLFFQKLFFQKKLSLDSVQMTDLAPSNMLPALVRGDIDAFVIFEPYIALARRELGENAVVFEPKGVYGETFNLVAGKNFAGQNPEKVKKFLIALIKAEEFYRNNKAQSFEIAQRYTGASSDGVGAVLNTFEISLRFDAIVTNQVREAAEWAISQKIVAAKTVPDLAPVFRTDFLKALKPSVVTIQ